MANPSLIYNIQLSRMFIVQRLAESIAENMRRRCNYEVSDYYHVCLDVLIKVGLDEMYVKALMKDVIHDAYELHFEYKRTGLYTYHNGSGAHPAILVSKEAQDLLKLLQMFEAVGSRREIAATQE
jgi:hypothetical protein